jgi:site-specific recombinase XerD
MSCPSTAVQPAVSDTVTSDLVPLVRVYVRDRLAVGELCPRTVPSFRRTLLRFADQADVAAHQLERAHVERFLALPVAQSTRVGRFYAMRGFCQWLVRQGYLEVDPMADLRAPRRPRPVPRAYTAEIVARLLAVCPDRRARLICLLEVQEGLRACEVARLEVGDVDFVDREVRVNGKAGRERILPVSAQTWGALEDYLREHPAGAGPLVRSYNDPTAGICAAHVVHMMSRWLRAAGVDRGGGHGLRHTMATTLLRGGADVRDVQCALGHASLSSTSVYLPFSDAKRLRRVMDGRWYGQAAP